MADPGPMRPVDAIYPARREAILADRCVPWPEGCGGPATEFREERSAREYLISGRCQRCQDSIWPPQVIE